MINNDAAQAGLSGAARLAGVIGRPVAHSRSPRLHGFWLRQYGIDGAYLPLAVEPRNLEQALHALPMLGFRGANITVPYKERALQLIDEADSLARRIGAVNTVTVGDDGRLRGSNTDAFGFLANLRDHVPDFDAARSEVLILGAGGAARAIAVALLDAGAPRLRIANRTVARAEELARAMDPVRITPVPWTERARGLDSCNLVVNSTTLGMAAGTPLDFDLTGAAPGTVVADIVYTPLRTSLLLHAARRGLIPVDGLGMLIHQARPGFEAWFGVKPESSAALRAMLLRDLGETAA